MSDCRCHLFRGEPDLDAERVAALIPTMGQWLASLTVFAPHAIPGRVSVSERLRARLRAEAGRVSADLVFWVGCLIWATGLVTVMAVGRS